MRNLLHKTAIRVTDFVIDNFYIKPKELLKLCIHPSTIKGPNYFPEKEEKSKFHIFCDQCCNILRSGSIDNYYYLYALNIKGFRRRNDYLLYKPFSIRRDKLNLSNPTNNSCILRNKLYFGFFAKSIGITSPENIAYIRNGDVFLLNDMVHTTMDSFVATQTGSFFCKPIEGECGGGIFRLDINNSSIQINNQPISISELNDRLIGEIFIVQRGIEQHVLQKQLHPSSINSIRLVTVRSLKDGHIVVLPSILRIGTGSTMVDNTSQGGIAVGFNLKTGRLNEFGFLKPQFGLRVETHPDSGIRFREYCIPYIHEAIEQAKYFHSFLNLHSIGWDIAIGPNGPIFIEGNDNWEINGPQSCNRGLAKEFKELFFN